MVHLIVLVHGLWGTTAHFDYISAQLERRKGAVIDEYNDRLDNLYGKEVVVYRTSGSQGYFTYDGIDVCGARTAKEVEDEVSRIASAGSGKVTKLSVVGYSLGGLISRFTIGLLHKRGFFKRNDIELVNFTTFCSPHVGVVVQGNRLAARAFNFIGQYVMSTTSKQLFLKDKFEKTGKPLLDYLSDPSGPFYEALSLFKHRSLYGNVINDHRCEWYTAGIDTEDPFQPNLVPLLEGPYVDRCDPVIYDYTKPLKFQGIEDSNNEDTAKKTFGAMTATTNTSLAGRSAGNPGFLAKTFYKVKSIAFGTWNYAVAALKTVFVMPVWFVALLTNAAIQGIRSSTRRRTIRRSMTFDEVLEGAADNVMDSVYTAFNTDQDDDGSEDPRQPDLSGAKNSFLKADLGPLEKKIIDRLNTLSWSKFPVHITKSTHTHAAVIVRYPSPKFTEGYIIVDHFVDSLEV